MGRDRLPILELVTGIQVYLCLTPAFMPCTADEYKTTRFFSDKEAPLWVSAIVLDTTQ